MSIGSLLKEVFLYRDVSHLTGNSVRHFRERIGLKQREVAQKLDISLRNYQKIEAGTVELKQVHALKLANSFGINPCYFYRPDRKRSLENLDIPCPVEILNMLKVGVHIVDLKGRMLYFNEFYRKNLGIHRDFSLDENVVHIWDFAGDETEAEAIKKELERIAKEKPAATPLFTRLLAKSGELMPVKIDWDYVKNKDGDMVGYLAMVTPHPSW